MVRWFTGRGSVALCAVLGSVAGFAVTLPTSMDGVLTIDIASDVVYDSVIPGGVTNLVKKGSGKATLATGNAGFTGAIEIREGTLAGCIKDTTAGTGYSYTQSFGDPARITIIAGATLESLDKGDSGVSPVSPRSHFFSGPLVVGGSGVGGLGAVRFSSVNPSTSMHNVWKNVTLTSATTLDASRRWGFGGGTFDMGGYDLTIIGGNIFELGRGLKNTWVNLGDIHVRNNASLLWESMNVSPLPTGYKVGDKTCHVSDGGCVRSFTTTYGNAKFPWGVVVSGTGKIMGYVNSQTWDWETNHPWQLDWYDYFNSPIVLKDADTVFKSDYYMSYKSETVNFGAGVDGPGRMIVGDDSWRRGQTVLRPASASTLGALKVYAGALIVMTNATLTVTNAPACNQWSEPTGVDSSASPVMIEGANSGDTTPRLVIENGGVFKTRFAVGVNDDTTASINDAITMIGHNAGTYGVLDVREGATVTNVPYVGLSGQGAILMRGGDVFFKTKCLGNIGIGNYGALVMDGGRLTTNAKLEIGTSARGFLVQRGGVIDFATDGKLSNAFSSQFSLARANVASYGCYYNCGGTLYAPKSQVWLMKHNNLGNGYGTEAFFTLDGANAKAQVRQVKSMVQTNTVKYGVVALRNGGELACDRMFRDNFIQECGASTVGKWTDIRNRDFTSRFHLVFDGGVLKTTKAGEFFSYEKLDGSNAEGVDATRLPERVLVYEKGAVIDTDGHDVVFRAPLAAPQGKGLDTVTLPAGVLTNVQYCVGPRRILVTDSANKLLVAGAVVDFNLTNRQQRAVIVMHPGESLPDTVKARIENAANNGWTDLTAANGGLTLRTLASGGLTKRGAGKLTLVAANTYGGKTRIEGGSLEFQDEGGLPGHDIEFSVGAVTSAVNGVALLTANRLNLNAGKKIRITGVDALDPDTFGRKRELISLTTPNASRPELELTDDAGAPVSARGWFAAWSEGGRKLSFGAAKGLMMILR